MKTRKWKKWLSPLLVMAPLLGLVAPVTAVAKGTGGLQPLNSVPVPLPPNLGDFVVNIPAAIMLGKALFWDMQVGGDGVQACASCHFQAGSDVRTINTIHPGKNNRFQLAKPGNPLQPARLPNILRDDVVGSQGVVNGNFLGILDGSFVDDFQLLPDPLFVKRGVNQRQVTGRNAPSAVNAVFYYRNFWDGRANNTFNGVTPFGPADDTAVVYEVVNGLPGWVKVSIPNASLASQAVGPPNNPVEMAFAGRTFPDLGQKLLGLTPLGQQQVDPSDSVLGLLAANPTGLNTTYAALIQAAFDPKWWNYNGTVANGYPIMEANFSLYFGLAVMLYESTLVSDQTPLDQFLSGDPAALTANQQLGLEVYIGKGRCNKCHSGAELSEATVSQAQGDPLTGFTNTGVKRRFLDGGDILQPGKGMFKASQLRNVELNGPYFHDGSYGTLRQVVDFYDRGGDFPSPLIDGDVRPLRLTEAERVALVDFMLAMTDERVRWERAPFDHPSLNIPNFGELPAVGAAGRTLQQGALGTFMGLSPDQP